jgi:hypothetical protein
MMTDTQVFPMTEQPPIGRFAVRRLTKKRAKTNVPKYAVFHLGKQISLPTSHAEAVKECQKLLGPVAESPCP